MVLQPIIQKGYYVNGSVVFDNSELRFEIENIKKKVDNHSKNIELVFQYLDELLEKKAKPRKLIGFKISRKK